MSSSSELNVAFARSHFPSLSSPNSNANRDFIYADNAGGTQILLSSAHKIYDYLLNTNVQLGATYLVGKESTGRIDEAVLKGGVLEMFGDKGNGEVKAEEIVWGPSSTTNVKNLAKALEGAGEIKKGDEIIITGEHESNCGPWKDVAKRVDAEIKYWHPRNISKRDNPFGVGYHVDDLLPLISSKTRLITFPATSNILGSVHPVKRIISAARTRGAEVGVRKLEFCIDCVAYAPHRRIDVSDWEGVEYVFWSWYKVFGPHLGVMYARKESLKSVDNLAHHFHMKNEDSFSSSIKLMPGNLPSYELVWGTTAVYPYLQSLTPSNTLEDAYAAIARYERSLTKRLLEWLGSDRAWKRGVRIVGDERIPADNEPEVDRAPTISFVVLGTKSKYVVEEVDKVTNPGIGIRYGHFYAYSLVKKLFEEAGKADDIDDGVIRVSLVHYNTPEEVDRILEALERVLFPVTN